MSPNTIISTKKHNRIAYDSRKANLNPLMICSKFGKKCSTLKKRSVRNILNINKNEMSISCVGIKNAMMEGMERITRMPSNRFQPDDQYPFSPYS